MFSVVMIATYQYIRMEVNYCLSHILIKYMDIFNTHFPPQSWQSIIDMILKPVLKRKELSDLP